MLRQSRGYAFVGVLLLIAFGAERGAAQTQTRVQTINVGDGTATFDRAVFMSTEKMVDKCVDYDHETRKCLETKRRAVPDWSIERLYLSPRDQGSAIVFRPYTYDRTVRKWECTKSEKVEVGDGKYVRECVSDGHWVTASDPDTSWFGCGRKAAQNVLRYFGIEVSQAEIAAYMKGTPMRVNDEIAVYPGHLRSGLQQLLDRFAKAKFKAKRHQHTHGEDVIPYLRDGLPVVALVDGGSHWVVVAGYDQGGYFIHDNWSFTRRAKLDLSFDRMNAAWAFVDGTDYEPGTFISFERR